MNIKLWIILFIGFVDYVGIGLVYPIFAVMLFDPHSALVAPETSFGYRGAFLGVLIGLTPITQFFSAPLLGTFSDLKGRRIALILGICTGCLGYLMAVVGIWSSSLALLFLYRILVGVSDSTAAVAQAVIADVSTEETKARNFGFLNSSLGLGFTIGPFIGGKFGDPNFASWSGYSVPFIISGCLVLSNLILVLWKFPETHVVKTPRAFKVFDQLNNIAKVFTWHHLKWLFLGGFAFSFAWSFFNEFIPVLMIKNFQFSSNDIGNFYGYTGAWYALSAALFIVPLLKHVSPERLVFLACLSCAAFLSIFSLIQNPFYIWLITPFVMCTLAIGFPTATTVVSNRTNEDCQGEVLGIYQSVQALAMGINPLFVGSLIGNYPISAVWGGVASMIVAAFAFWMARKRNHTIPN